MEVLKAVQFLGSVVNHPLNSHRKLQSAIVWLRWHLGSRLVPGPVLVPFVNDSRLLVKPGLRGATENIYTGLYDFEDMSFLLHLLQPDDTFLDVGANVGSYTVLASRVRGAKSITFEPIPHTFFNLLQNINVNWINDIVEAHNIGVGKEEGVLRFTSSHDAGNHVIAEGEVGEPEPVEVKVAALDSIVGERNPTLMKIDVEGFEYNVIAGGQNTLSKETLLAVILELNGSADRYGYDENLIHSMMLSHGFSTFDYQPFTRKLIPLGGKKQYSRNTLYLRNVEAIEQRLNEAPRFRVNGIEI
jgi:FkbM family methyltransferase